ncbi:MAG: hypothetical protein ABW185_24210, partial [Sedimenticola sp.]
MDLRADKTLRELAIQRLDERIISVTSRDIVAAEAHFHRSCYRAYTRPQPEVHTQNVDPYKDVENAALNSLFAHIRDDLFSNPRIVPLTYLTDHVVSFMDTSAMEKCTESTKKNIRRTIEKEFGDSLHFITVGRRVYVRPDNLTTDSVIIDFIRLQDTLDTYKEDQTYESLIKRVAFYIRSEIKNGKHEQQWPPHPEQLDSSYYSSPDCLIEFLTTLFSGKHEPSIRTCRLTWSVAQDIVSAVTQGEVLTPKHILLPWAVKTLTGNAELLKMVNRLGHGCSYTRLEEIDTALCIEKTESTGSGEVPLPTSIHPSVPTVLAFDNIDRQEEVLSGAGTSHRVNGIIVQPMSLSCAPPPPVSSVQKKDKKRTVKPLDIPLPIYVVGKRQSPPPVVPSELTSALTTARSSGRQRDLLWIMVRAYNTEEQVSSWTGFNILTRDHVEVIPDTIGYLPTVNVPTTEASTVQEVL